MRTGLARSETPGMYGNTVLENREVLRLPAADGAAGRVGEVQGHTPTMNGHRGLAQFHSNLKSFRTRPGSSHVPTAAEEAEGRGLAKGNPHQQNASRDAVPDRRAKCAGAGTAGGSHR